MSSIQFHKHKMGPSIDQLQSTSFNSSTTTATDIHRSTSSGSDWASSSAHFPSSTTLKFNSSSGDSIHRPFHSLSLSDIRFLRRLGAGDIGAVYLAELNDPPTNNPIPTALFAAKVMDRKELANRKKEGRARTEREILEMLDHPFLPKLYAAIQSPNWSCLLTEFCSGGDLHVLRQLQPRKRFPDSAVRFYASEVVVALEYLHMMGIVFRDLKPENVLVRSDGHIMLTDFDLSLRCDDSTSTPARLISTQNPRDAPPPSDEYVIDPLPFGSTPCILPNCIVPVVSCFHLKRKRKKKPARHVGPEFVVEPIGARSMSFVGTHEYLAPEIVSGEGHGSAVDWWTLGIFIFEMFYGFTPFRGTDHEITLANIVARALDFPKEPHVPASAKDLISQLLSKERRIGATMGSSTIKRHPFFHGVNWALLRCTNPPFVPPRFSRDFLSDESCPGSATPVDYY